MIDTTDGTSTGHVVGFTLLLSDQANLCKHIQNNTLLPDMFIVSIHSQTPTGEAVEGTLARFGADCAPARGNGTPAYAVTSGAVTLDNHKVAGRRTGTVSLNFGGGHIIGSFSSSPCDLTLEGRPAVAVCLTR